MDETGSANSQPAQDLGPLIDDFLQRIRQGENPSLSQLIEQSPEHREEIERLVPTLMALENAADEGSEGAGPEGAYPEEAGQREWIGDFRILRCLGRGGMGIVYLAEQKSLQREVALKVLPGTAALQPEQRDRFRREVRAAAALHHPAIVPVFAVGDERGLHYYAMQYIEGCSVEDVIAARANSAVGSREILVSFPEQSKDPIGEETGQAGGQKTLSAWSLTGPSEGSSRGYYDRVAQLGMSVCSALSYAHARGILHRDIKPANILLDGTGSPWVADFGLARIENDGLTKTGDIVGTLRYMAPERFHGWCDPRGDVYGLGLTLYELITGRPAIVGSTRAELVRNASDPVLVRPVRYRPDVPRDLETVILKATAAEPTTRYQTAAEMEEELRLFLQRKPVRARRPNLKDRLLLWLRRNPLVGLIAGISCVLLSVLAVIMASTASRLQTRGAELTAALTSAQDAALAEQEAHQLANRRLFESLLVSAEATLHSGRPGQSFQTLDTVQAAADMFGVVTPDEEEIRKLRDTAVAAMLLDDIAPAVEHPDPCDATDYHARTDADLIRDRVILPNHKGIAELRTLRTNKLIGSLPGRWSVAYGRPGVRFSPDGRLAAVSGFVGYKQAEFVLYDIASRRELERVAIGSDGYSRAFRFSSQGQLLARMEDTQLVVIQLPTLREILRTDVGIHARSLAFSPDGRQIVFVSGNRLKVTSVPGAVTEVVATTAAELIEVDWSKNGNLIAAAADDESIYVWHTRSMKEPLQVLQGHRSDVRHVEFHPRSGLLGSWSWDSTTRFWNPVLGQELFSLSSMRITGFSPEGDQSAFERPGQTFGAWRVRAGDYGYTYHAGDSAVPVLDADFHPTGNLLTVTTVERQKLISLPFGSPSLSLGGVSRHLGGRFTADGRFLWAASTEGIRQYAIPSLVASPEKPASELLFRRQSDSQTVFSLSKSGYRYALWLRAGEVCVGKIQPDGAPVIEQTFAVHPECWYPELNPDGTLLALSGKRMDSVDVIDADSGRLLFREQSSTEPGARAFFSADGCYLIVCRREFRVYSTGDWTLQHVIPRLEPGFGRAAWSPDGEYLAVQDLRVVRLFRTGSWEPLLTLPAPYKTMISVDFPEGISALTFSPDGRLLACGGYSGILQVWDLDAIRHSLRDLHLNWEEAPIHAETNWPLWIPAGPDNPGFGISSGQIAPGIRQRRRQADLLIEADPDNSELLRRRKTICREQGDESAVLTDYRTLDALGVLTKEELRARAELLIQSGDEQDALRDLRRLLQLVPDDAAAANNLAWILLTGSPSLRHPEEALHLARTASAQEPENTDYVNSCGVALYYTGDYPSALELLLKNAEVPGNGSRVFDLFPAAAAAARCDQPDLAEQLYRRGLDAWASSEDLPDQWRSQIAEFAVEAAVQLRIPSPASPPED